MREKDLKVLVVGGGGREHALAWKIAQSPRVAEVYAAPGNPGIAQQGWCVNIGVKDFDALIDFAQAEKIDLTVVGPESPLIAGLVDEFESRGLAVFGPNKAAAQMEGSKMFAKDLMREFGIPTASYEKFDDINKATAYIESLERPVWIKADGEAAGKGAIFGGTKEDAIKTLNEMMVEKVFGTSGERVVIEENLSGQEASLMAIVDGDTVAPLLPAQDYKRAYDNDQGLNTGGMGCYSPVPVVPQETYDYCVEKIIRPTLSALLTKGIHYRGLLYTGIMLTEDGPKVIEFNCRFGDPETQVVLPLMETDLVDVMEAAVEGKLDKTKINWYHKKAVCVVVASGGYPGSYETGFPITGLSEAESEGAVVFHAGTKMDDGEVVTAGGRVLGVTAAAEDYKATVEKVYRAVGKIHFDRMHYRKDIGARLL